MVHYLPVFLETGCVDRLCYTLTKDAYKNQDGVLLTCVPSERLCYTSAKEAYKDTMAESLMLRFFFLVMNFTLIAKETVPHKAKYSLAPVTVHIRDMNDNFPDFTQPFYEVRFCT
jgi:hypothetical protein